MRGMDNYQISRDRAKALFLSFDQEALIRRWKLTADAEWITVEFLGEPCAICRQTGAIFHRDGAEAGFGTVLSVFDLLCHEGEEKHPSFHYAPVNSLKGGAPVGVAADFHSQTAERFCRDPEAFCAACQSLGGEAVDLGDLGFRLPVFGQLSVILKLYHADEDFSASLTLLWDENMLQYTFYETVFYIAGCLLDAITRKMHRFPNDPHP